MDLTSGLECRCVGGNRVFHPAEKEEVMVLLLVTLLSLVKQVQSEE